VIRRERRVHVVMIAKIDITFVATACRVFDKLQITDPADRYSLTISRTTTRTKNDSSPPGTP
jgi:hypothetical protein